MGITSWSSASKTLFLSALICSSPPFLPSPSIASHHLACARQNQEQSQQNIPIEILTRPHSNQRITIRQRRKDTDPILISPILSLSLFLPAPASPSFPIAPMRTISRGRGANAHSLEFSNCARTAIFFPSFSVCSCVLLYVVRWKWSVSCA